jgi:hypothetical protein
MIHDPLLFKRITNVPLAVIKEKVAEAARIDINMMTVPNHYPLSRKREYVNARQISMKLSKQYSRCSLAKIGSEHGGRDHATVLHACKTVDNLIDTNDADTIYNYNKSRELINIWYSNKNEKLIAISTKRKAQLIKHWIKCKVPLHIRLKKLNEYGHICSKCGQLTK